MAEYSLYDNSQSYEPILYPNCKTGSFMPAKIPYNGFSDDQNYYGTEFANDKDLEFLIRDPVIKVLFEDNFADASDINCRTTFCNQNSRRVKYPEAVKCFDHLKENSNFRAENTQGYKGTHNELNRNLFNLQFEPVSYTQEQLQAKKMELLPSASLLVSAIKRVESKTIPSTNVNNDETNNVLCENVCLSLSHCHEQGRKNISEASDKENTPQIVPKIGCIKRTHNGEKDDRYWNRRVKNNAAAKKSREAKKSRFIFMEERIKELENENAAMKDYLRILTQKVLESEREHTKSV